MKGSIRLGIGFGLLLVAGMSVDTAEILTVLVLSFIGGASLMSGWLAAKETGAL